MIILISILIFIIGASVGSFLNVVIWRLPRNLGILFKRSQCPACGVPIKILDLVPILSYLVLAGKCRNCGKPISLQYPIVEAVTASLFLVSFIWWFSNFGPNFQFLPQLFHQFFIISVLILVFVIDAKFGIIPDSIIKWAILGSVILVLSQSLIQFFTLFFSLKYDPSGLGKYLLETNFVANQIKELGADFGLRLVAAIVVTSFFGFLIFITRGRGMGLGDAKLGFWLGFVFSLPQIFLAIFLSFIIGAVVSVFLILKGTKKFGQTLPFGPFLATGSLISLFFGRQLLAWYLGLWR